MIPINLQITGNTLPVFCCRRWQVFCVTFFLVYAGSKSRSMQTFYWLLK